jgi:hypothetical protein
LLPLLFSCSPALLFVLLLLLSPFYVHSLLQAPASKRNKYIFFKRSGHFNSLNTVPHRDPIPTWRPPLKCVYIFVYTSLCASGPSYSSGRSSALRATASDPALSQIFIDPSLTGSAVSVANTGGFFCALQWHTDRCRAGFGACRFGPLALGDYSTNHLSESPLTELLLTTILLHLLFFPPFPPSFALLLSALCACSFLAPLSSCIPAV